MKVKHNFSKDATALLLGCLYLLGTSLQAQFGGDGLEQAKPPYRLHHFGTLTSDTFTVTAEPRGDKIQLTGELIRTLREWFSPKASLKLRSDLVYQETTTYTKASRFVEGKDIINWDPHSARGSFNRNFLGISLWVVIKTCRQDSDGKYLWQVERIGRYHEKQGPGGTPIGAPREMPDWVGSTSTYKNPLGSIKQVTQSTRTSTRSVEVFNDSGQPIRLALTLPYTDRYVPSVMGQFVHGQWVPQQGVWSSQPLTIPVGASTTLDMALPQGWRAGKFLPESITILSGGGAGGGPGQPGM